IYITFYENLFGKIYLSNRDILFIKSTDGGNTFTTPINLSNNENQSTFPYIILDKLGNINVLWQDFTPSAISNEDILLARSTDGGLSFTKPINISDNSGKSVGVAGAADREGNLLIIWTDDSSAETDIFSDTLIFNRQSDAHLK